MVEARTWWRRPELRDDQRRSVGWLELFFDLVFVVVVARLAHYLAGHLNPRAVLEFVIMFAGVFWIWNAFTYYTERFESPGLEDRFFTFLALLPVAGLAVFAEGGLREHHDEFAIAYLAARSINMLGWFRAARSVPRFRPVATRFYAGFAVVAVLLLISMESGTDERLFLWAVAVLIDVLTPSLTMRHQAELPPISVDRFPERFGLFTMFVLGECVVGVISALSDLSDGNGLRSSTWLTAPLGLAIAFGLWWMYFDFVARRPPRQNVRTILVWVYLHLAMVIMIAVTGAGISLAILDDATGALEGASQRLLATGVGGALIAVALLETTLLRKRDEPTHQLMSPFLKVATGSLALLAGWAAQDWSTASLFLLLLTSIVIPCAYGVLVWYAALPVPAPVATETKTAAATDERPLIVDSPPPPLPARRETKQLTRLTDSGATSKRSTPTTAGAGASTSPPPAPASTPAPAASADSKDLHARIAAGLRSTAGQRGPKDPEPEVTSGSKRPEPGDAPAASGSAATEDATGSTDPAEADGTDRDDRPAVDNSGAADAIRPTLTRRWGNRRRSSDADRKPSPYRKGAAGTGPAPYKRAADTPAAPASSTDTSAEPDLPTDTASRAEAPASDTPPAVEVADASDASDARRTDAAMTSPGSKAAPDPKAVPAAKAVADTTAPRTDTAPRPDAAAAIGRDDGDAGRETVIDLTDADRPEATAPDPSDATGVTEVIELPPELTDTTGTTEVVVLPNDLAASTADEAASAAEGPSAVMVDEPAAADEPGSTEAPTPDDDPPPSKSPRPRGKPRRR